MIHSQISLLGMYNYDDTILDEMVIPSEIDRETLIDNLLMETADLELLYSDGDFLKKAVGVWSKKNLSVWEKLLATTLLEYNPIWNVDGTTREERVIDQTKQFSENGKDSRTGTDNRTGTEKRTGTGTEKTTTTASDESESTQNTTGDTLNKSNTFNSGSMIDNNKTESEGTGKTNTTGSSEGESNTTRSDSDDTTSTEAGTRAESGTSEKSGDEVGKTKEVLETERHGNIGVTTTQQMIREEREVAMFNIIDYIIKDFMNRFCLLVY